MKRLLTKKQIMLIPELFRSGKNRKEIAKALNVSSNTIQRLFRGESYPEFQIEFQKRLKKVNIYLNTVRTCTKCGETFPRTSKFFPTLYVSTSRETFEARCRVCKKKQNNERYKRIKFEVLSHYSKGTPTCECCLEKLQEFLTIDHINGGGRQHRKELREGPGGVSSIYIWLYNNRFPEGFRVLCFNCNAALGMFGYCPHRNE